jgi:hypothetical protein
VRIFIEGVYIPNTNEWWIDDTYTVSTLIAEVIKVAGRGPESVEGYTAHTRSNMNKGSLIRLDETLYDILSDGSTVYIKEVR